MLNEQCINKIYHKPRYGRDEAKTQSLLLMRQHQTSSTHHSYGCLANGSGYPAEKKLACLLHSHDVRLMSPG